MKSSRGGQIDLHAEARERKRRKAQYGMRVTGRSVRLLAQLSSRTVKSTARKHKKSR